MNKYLAATLSTLAILFGSASANAAIVTWTLSDIKFDYDGFQTQHLFGTFYYDKSTNTFSNSNLSISNDSHCCWGSAIDTTTSTASILKFSTSAYLGDGYINLASFLTDAGGTIALTSGSVESWTLRAGQSISAPIAAPVPEPASWALMISGFALAGAAMRRQSSVMRAAFA